MLFRRTVYNRVMFRLLSLAAFTTLLLLIVCGAGHHDAQSHTAHFDGIELPPAVPSPTALESASDLRGITVSVPAKILVTRWDNAERFRAAPPETISFLNPLSASSVLRV
jgi:hypothetical protein